MCSGSLFEWAGFHQALEVGGYVCPDTADWVCIDALPLARTTAVYYPGRQPLPQPGGVQVRHRGPTTFHPFTPHNVFMILW